MPSLNAAHRKKGLGIWFTGLSGAGKTTLANEVARSLRVLDMRVCVLDGDEVRRNLCSDLGFSRKDRDENVARLGYVAGLLVEQGVVVLVAAISPYREARSLVRRQVSPLLEVYVNASIATCVRRDTKGLYAKAMAGEIPHFTGISDPYEPPLAPDVECLTDCQSVEESTSCILRAVKAAMQSRPASIRKSIGCPEDSVRETCAGGLSGNRG